jgi:hypothetical protein
MTERSGGAFFLFRALTEVLWVMAAAGFTVHVTVGTPFSFLPGAAAFLGGAALTRALSGRGLRRITAVAVHAAFLFGCLLWGQGGKGVPAGGDWAAWGWTIQTAFFISFLWFKGVGVSSRPGTRERVCDQFDKGVAWFGLVFLISFVVEVRGGLPASWAGTFPLFLVFFVSGIAAMGLAGKSSHEARGGEYAPGVGTVLGFGALVAGAGTGVILLLMPILMYGAEIAAEALKTTTSPLGPVLVGILRFLFGRRRAPLKEEASPETRGTADSFGADF